MSFRTYLKSHLEGIAINKVSLSLLHIYYNIFFIKNQERVMVLANGKKLPLR